ncbi:MAG: hypothetical protein ACYCOU_05755 [Sulfobacillus sp.]
MGDIATYQVANATIVIMRPSGDVLAGGTFTNAISYLTVAPAGTLPLYIQAMGNATLTSQEHHELDENEEIITSITFTTVPLGFTAAAAFNGMAQMTVSKEHTATVVASSWASLSVNGNQVTAVFKGRTLRHDYSWKDATLYLSFTLQFGLP